MLIPGDGKDERRGGDEARWVLQKEMIRAPFRKPEYLLLDTGHGTGKRAFALTTIS